MYLYIEGHCIKSIFILNNLCYSSKVAYDE